MGWEGRWRGSKIQGWDKTCFSPSARRAADEDVEGAVADTSAERVQAWFLLQHCFSIPPFRKHNLEHFLHFLFLLTILHVCLNVVAMSVGVTIHLNTCACSRALEWLAKPFTIP